VRGYERRPPISLDNPCGSLVTKNGHPLTGITQDARQPQSALAVLILYLGLNLETFAQLAFGFKVHVARIYSLSNLRRPGQDLLLLGFAHLFAFQFSGQPCLLCGVAAMRATDVLQLILDGLDGQLRLSCVKILKGFGQLPGLFLALGNQARQFVKSAALRLQ